VKLLFPLATCFVHGQPLLLNLDEREYTDRWAFALLTENIELWEEGEPWKRKKEAKNVDDPE
jgi:hypothetical protein